MSAYKKDVFKFGKKTLKAQKYFKNTLHKIRKDLVPQITNASDKTQKTEIK